MRPCACGLPKGVRAHGCAACLARRRAAVRLARYYDTHVEARIAADMATKRPAWRLAVNR
jgi:hypothetical protein